MAQKVLIADDGIASRLLFEKVLSNEGYVVITVGSGPEVLDRVKENQPDIALIDAVMPEVDGYQICETLKNNPNFKNLPLILLAGKYEGFDRDKGINLVGPGAILDKPATSNVIISKVKEFLEARKAESVEQAPAEIEDISETGVIQEPQMVQEEYEFDEDSEEADLVVESEILDEDVEFDEVDDEFVMQAGEELEEPVTEAEEEIFIEEPQETATPVLDEIAPESSGTIQISAEKLDTIAEEIAQRVAGKLIPVLIQELANSFMQLPAVKSAVENTSKKLVKDLLPQIQEKL